LSKLRRIKKIDSDDSYRTVADVSRAEIKIKKSRFIATVFPSKSRQEAEAEIEKIGKEFHDARHNCFAFNLRPSRGQEDFRYSDDGEPSGTAGRPIYESILHFNLFETGIVVTRYFGGIKLGTGGLARAYRDAARAALEKAVLKTVLIVDRFRIEFALNFTNIILRLLSTDGIKIISSNYTDKGEIIFEVRKSLSEEISGSLTAATEGKAGLEKIIDDESERI